MNRQEMTVWQAFSAGEAFLMVNKDLLKKAGAQEAIYLSNLVDKMLYFIRREMDDDGWFYYTHEQQMQDVCIKSERTLRRVKNIWKNRGVVETKMQGCPAREYYRLDLKNLEDFLYSEDPDDPDGTDGESSRCRCESRTRFRRGSPAGRCSCRSRRWRPR